MTNPDQDLKNAKSIYDRYIKGNYEITPSWILFSEGKALVKKGYIHEGISKFKKITFSNYSLMEFIKAQLKIIQSFIKYSYPSLKPTGSIEVHPVYEPPVDPV